MKGLDFSEEFEQAHPIVATAAYIGETLVILGLGGLAIFFLIHLLIWAVTF